MKYELWMFMPKEMNDIPQVEKQLQNYLSSISYPFIITLNIARLIFIGIC